MSSDKAPASSKNVRPTHPDAGFTYIGLLILVAVLGITSAATLQLGALMERRAAEEELLEIGTEFHKALASYANATPPGQPREPKILDDLLKDPRYPNTVRHLRKLYADPITGKEEWGVIMAAGGNGIMGVHSLSDATPIKVGNFAYPFQEFTEKTSYREWQFLVRPELSTSANAGGFITRDRDKPLSRSRQLRSQAAPYTPSS